MSPAFQRRALAAIVLVFCSLASIDSAYSVPRTWIRPGGVGGLYSVDNYWSPAGVPQAADDVFFSLANMQPTTIMFTQDRTATDLMVESGNVLLGSTSNVTYQLDNIHVEGDGQLNVSNILSGLTNQFTVDAPYSLDVEGRVRVVEGAILRAGDTVLNSLAASDNPLLQVTGINGSSQASAALLSSLTIGADNAAGVEVSAGGAITVNSLILHEGHVSIAGASAAGNRSSITATGVVAFGANQVGELSVTAGAMLQTSGAALGYYGGTAHITIDGTDSHGNGSQWNVANTVHLVNGDIGVSSGGRVSANGTNLEGGLVTIEGVGSKWSSTGTFTASGGSMYVEQGAHLETETTYVGNFRNGRVTLSDDSSAKPSRWDNSGDVYVGGNFSNGTIGSGTVTLNDRGVASIGGKLKIWGEGKVYLYDSSSLVAGQIENTDGGLFDFQGGALQTPLFFGDLTNSGGRLTPGGPAPGFMSVQGDYTQEANAVLELEIGGNNPGGSHDFVTVIGDADLGGLLKIAMHDGFVPTAEDTFTVLASGGISGVFTNIASGVRLDTTDGAGSFRVNYGIGSNFDPSHIVLTEFRSNVDLPGDYNGDGAVNLADYTVWRNNLGAPAGSLLNDIDGGTIGQIQYATWKSHFGNSLSPSSLAVTKIATVPEPHSLGIVGVITLAVFLGCSRKRAD